MDDLIKRLQEAGAGNFDLDMAIADAAKATDRSWSSWPYTTSLDAIVALIGEKLAGWTLANLCQQDDKSWFCELREGYLTSYGKVAMSSLRHRPPTAPLACCQALLTALHQQETKPCPSTAGTPASTSPSDGSASASSPMVETGSSPSAGSTQVEQEKG